MREAKETIIDILLGLCMIPYAIFWAFFCWRRLNHDKILAKVSFFVALAALTKKTYGNEIIALLSK